MIDIPETEKKVNQIDSLLTSITKVLKKHWIIISLILVGTFFYFVITAPDEEVYEEDTEYVEEFVDDSTYVDELPAEE